MALHLIYHNYIYLGFLPHLFINNINIKHINYNTHNLSQVVTMVNMELLYIPLKTGKSTKSTSWGLTKT